MIKHSLGYDARRNLDQYQIGGSDIEIPGWSIECKAYKSGTIYRKSWWDQCVSNCKGKKPVLIYKFNNHPIKCVVRINTLSRNFSNTEELLCEVDFDTWCYIVREKIDVTE